MSLNLNRCDARCHECIIDYGRKHNLKKGDKFQIFGCEGIPIEYVPRSVSAALGDDPEIIQAAVDPVMWAKKYLDWHCWDPDGEIWKRKTKEGTLGGFPEFKFGEEEYEKRIAEGKSIFHRPYQRTMLECTSKRKVFRLGRQLGKTESLCVSILFNLFNHENFNVEVITPYQSQISLIFERLVSLVQSSSILSSSIKQSVKSPQYVLSLKNGSRVTGFTAGTRSKQEAGASRGQHASMLVFDECDFLSPQDIDAALAVILNYPDATVWMSSTPTGRREKFFESCRNPQYKEFHHPSTINPNWNETTEAYFRSEYTEAGYNHEILAEWGAQEEGVYQHKYIEAAQAEYEYGDLTPTPSWVYTIGVDWNDHKTGTTIAVVGFNPSDNYFYLVEKRRISRGETTQLSACYEIAKLNSKWYPASIYVDQGFGYVQVEVLRKFGADALAAHGPNHPDSRLRDIVTPYDFGSSIEVRDLFTKQPVKKPAKPFLVENSVRRFESQQFKYPKTDKDYTAQLMGYIIDRVSVTGRPIYLAQNEKAGDHFLDAVNLALVAFTLEKTDFGRPSYTNKLHITGGFGEQDVPNLRKIQEELDSYKPGLNRVDTFKRDETILKSDKQDLPASNNRFKAEVKLWAWPGFLNDAPRPKSRTQRMAGNILAPSRSSNRPKRKKF